MTLQGDLFQGSAATPSDDEEATPIPFRFDVRDATPEVIAARNEAEDTKRARRYLPTDRATDMAYTAKSAVDDRLKSWIYHPSESVPIAMIRNPGEPPWKTYRGRDRRPIHAALYRRAAADAREEGVLWTPLLNRLDRSRMWPRPGNYRASRYLTPGGESPYSHPEDHNEIQVPPARGCHKQIGDWIEEQDDPRRVEQLLAYNNALINELVAKRTGCIDAAFVERMLEDEAHLHHFASNPHLEGAHLETVVEHVYALFEGTRTQEDYEDGKRYGPGTYPHAIDRAEWGLRNLLSADQLEDPRAAFERMMDVLRSNDAHRGARHMQAARSAVECFSDIWTEDDLFEIFSLSAARSVQPSGRAVERLIRHEAATPRFWSHVLEESSDFEVRVTVARQEGALTDARIRDQLSETSSYRLLEQLHEAAPEGESRAEIFRELAKSNPTEARSRLTSDRTDALASGELEGEALERAAAAYRYAFKAHIRQDPADALDELRDPPYPWTDRFLTPRSDYIDMTMKWLARKDPTTAIDHLSGDEEPHPWMEDLSLGRTELFDRALHYLSKQDPEEAVRRLSSDDPWTKDLSSLEEARRTAWRALVESAPDRANARLYQPRASIDNGDQPSGDGWLLELDLSEIMPLLESVRTNRLKTLLTSRPDLLTSDKHRPRVLAQIPSTYHLETLWKVVPEEVRPDYFRHVVGAGQEEDASTKRLKFGVTLLEKEEGLADRLSAEDVLPLLTATDGDIRQRAILATAALEKGVTADPPTQTR